MREKINALLKVEKYEIKKGNKGLKVYLKLYHGEEIRPFFMCDTEIDKMYEILHRKDWDEKAIFITMQIAFTEEEAIRIRPRL